MTNIFARGIAEFFRAVIGKFEVNLRLAQIAAIDACPLDDVAVKSVLRLLFDDELLQPRRAVGLLVNVLEQFIAIRNRLAVLDDFVAVVIDHAEFQKRRLLNLRFGTVFVGLRKTGQLDENTIATGRLNHRLGHAETVNALAQHFDGLRQRAAGVVRVRELGRVHLDEERRAALQIQSQLILPAAVALQTVQNKQIRVNLILRGDERKVFLQIVRARRELERGELVRAGLLQRRRLRKDVLERGVLILRAAGKFLHQIPRRRWINLQTAPTG